MGEGGQNADSPHWEIPSRGGPWHLLWLDISKKVAEARISSQNAWEMVNVEGFAHARHTAAAFFGESNSAVCQSKVLKLTNHRYPLSDPAGPPRQGRQKVADSRNSPPPIKENEIKLLLKNVFTLASFQSHCMPFYGFTWISRRQMLAAMKEKGHSGGFPLEASIHSFVWGLGLFS